MGEDYYGSILDILDEVSFLVVESTDISSDGLITHDDFIKHVQIIRDKIEVLKEHK